MPIRFQTSDPAVGGTEHRFRRVSGAPLPTLWRGVAFEAMEICTRWPELPWSSTTRLKAPRHEPPSDNRDFSGWKTDEHSIRPGRRPTSEEALHLISE